MNRIEQEIIAIKEGYNDLVIKFEKHIGKKKLGEIPKEFMNEENNNVVIHPIETCNKLGEIKVSRPFRARPTQLANPNRTRGR